MILKILLRKLRRSMVRVPWLIIMGSRPKTNGTRIVTLFRMILKYAIWSERPQTGGYGITLTAANTVIYYSNGYDLEKRLQSEDRAHRIGQHKPVTYVDILAEETVDEKIVKSLRKKINIASEVSRRRTQIMDLVGYTREA